MRSNLGIDTSPEPALPSIFIIASQARAAKGDAYSHLSLITPGCYRTANGASSQLCLFRVNSRPCSLTGPGRLYLRNLTLAREPSYVCCGPITGLMHSNTYPIIRPTIGTTMSY
jgi:hypothetical protein